MEEEESVMSVSSLVTWMIETKKEGEKCENNSRRKPKRDSFVTTLEDLCRRLGKKCGGWTFQQAHKYKTGSRRKSGCRGERATDLEIDNLSTAQMKNGQAAFKWEATQKNGGQVRNRNLRPFRS